MNLVTSTYDPNRYSGKLNKNYFYSLTDFNYKKSDINQKTYSNDILQSEDVSVITSYLPYFAEKDAGFKKK